MSKQNKRKLKSKNVYKQSTNISRIEQALRNLNQLQKVKGSSKEAEEQTPLSISGGTSKESSSGDTGLTSTSPVTIAEKYEDLRFDNLEMKLTASTSKELSQLENSVKEDIHKYKIHVIYWILGFGIAAIGFIFGLYQKVADNQARISVIESKDINSKETANTNTKKIEQVVKKKQ